MQKIIIATHNLGKFEEIRDYISQATQSVQLVNMKDAGLASPDETGDTFIENALIKARAACESTGLPAIADDSGLVVETLGGEPGVRSARFAGDNATDADNIAALIARLKASDQRIHPAHYHCTLVFARHAKDPDPIVSQARWHGQMCLTPQGEGGFGYDPIFYDPTLGCSAADLTLEEKNNISHRGRALKMLVDTLDKLAWFHR